MHKLGLKSKISIKRSAIFNGNDIKQKINVRQFPIFESVDHFMMSLNEIEAKVNSEMNKSTKLNDDILELRKLYDLTMKQNYDKIILSKLMKAEIKKTLLYVLELRKENNELEKLYYKAKTESQKINKFRYKVINKINDIYENVFFVLKKNNNQLEYFVILEKNYSV